MERSVVLAGFGGQGILFAGEALARAGLAQGMEVLWLPSYGPEMRGGTANCTVIAAAEPIGSPVVDHIDAAIVLNPPSLARFLPLVAHDGLVIVNDSLIEAAVERADVRVLRIRCTALAREAGGERLTSVVALGALVAAMGTFHAEAVQAALCAMVERKHPELIEGNLQAFEAGRRAVFDPGTVPVPAPAARPGRA